MGSKGGMGGCVVRGVKAWSGVVCNLDGAGNDVDLCGSGEIWARLNSSRAADSSSGDDVVVSAPGDDFTV